MLICPSSSGLASEVREAMYCGVPVLVSADSDIGAWIQPYSTDAVVAGGDSDYATKVAAIVADRAAALLRAEKLRTDILRDNSWEFTANIIVHAITKRGEI